MRKSILFILLFIFTLPMMGDNVKNVRVRQEGKSIIVTYDLEMTSKVRLMMASGDSDSYVELKSVAGNVGDFVTAGVNRIIVYSPLDMNEKFVAKNVRFKVDATIQKEKYNLAISSINKSDKTKKIKTLVSAQMGYAISPQLSCGVMFGQTYYGLGWYVNARSNFNLKFINWRSYYNPSSYIYTGRKQTRHYLVNAGFMLDVFGLRHSKQKGANTLGFYVGGGYGNRDLLARRAGGDWDLVRESSSSGFSGNVGVCAGWKWLTFNVGLNTIDFEYLETELGLGITF